MAPGGTRSDSGERDLTAELEAERAATDHWRRVARQRSAAFAELQRRPAVRAVVALDRRLRPLRRSVGLAAERLRPRVERLTLGAAAVVHRGGDAPDLSSALDGLPPPTIDARGVTLVVVGSCPLSVFLGAAAAARRPIETVRVGPGRDTVADVDRALRQADHPLVALVRATSEPLDACWLDRLTAAIEPGVVAATPVLVHPVRPRTAATPHDGRVRSAGLLLEVSGEGVPWLRGAQAGTVPDPGRPSSEVDAGSAACLVLDRASYEAAGGLTAQEDLQVAVLELCGRLRARGGRIVVVPGAVVVDHLPVRSWAELRGPVDPDGPEWRDALERSGPTLLRSARPLPAGSLRWAVTVAAPSAKVAARWGDWHLAEGLAGALRRHGQEVRVQTLDRSDDPATRTCDVHLVLRGLEPVRRISAQRHVLWIISHPESIEDEELDAADLVLAASPRFAQHLRSRTTTRVDVMLQATDERRFFPRPADPSWQHPVVVVAKTRDVVRSVVADATAVGIRPAIYGGGWRDFVDPSLLVADHLANDQLPFVYSSAGVVLNDHWRTMRAWGFVSNRVYDVLACGTPVISDPVEGMADLFDGGVLEYHTPVELRELVDDVLANPEAARDRAARGRAAVLASHTFDHRALQLLAALAGP